MGRVFLALAVLLPGCVRLGFGVPAANRDGASPDLGVDRGPAGVDAAIDTGTTIDAADGAVDAPPPLLGPLKLTAGYDHTCALLPGGRVKCWGANDFGQLGQGHTRAIGDEPGEMGAALPFVDLGPGAVAVDIGAGHEHTCALLASGSVRCWGSGLAGQLGNERSETIGDQPGETAGPAALLIAAPGLKVVQLSVQKRNVCLRYEDKSLRCNGQNDYGQLGYGLVGNLGDEPGEMDAALAPVDLGDGHLAEAVIEGDYHTCALLDDARVKCWGRGHYGRLGLGDSAHRPVSPSTLPAVELPGDAIALYRTYFGTCVVLADGGARCWGGNIHGELGRGDTDSAGDAPGEMGLALPAIAPGGGRRVTAIHGGYHQICIILDDRTLRCAGLNDVGQLGRGGTDSYGDEAGETWAALAPIDLGAGRRLRDSSLDSIAVGQAHVCVVLDDGSVKCWGNNAFGQLGQGDAEHRGDGPGEMGDALPVVSLE